MVHGAFCGGWMYERFRTPFEEAGHEVLAPDLPGRGGAAGEQCAVAGFSMRDFSLSVASVCAAQREPPALIGHSLGGLVAQLAALTPVRALILLAPSHPWGTTVGTPAEVMSAFSLYAPEPWRAQAITPDYGMARRYLFDKLSRGLALDVRPDDARERLARLRGLAQF
jgi:pimeloyl-ACP methyl ester carboxylesterase